MDLINKIDIFEPIKGHIYESNISLIILSNLMFNYAKPIIAIKQSTCNLIVL